MYTFYYCDGTRAAAAEMALAEAGAPYTSTVIDISKDEHRSAEYLAVNPRGTVPALAVNNQVVACETIAIMMYVADEHQATHIAPPPGNSTRATMLDWLSYHACEVQEPMKVYYYPWRYSPNDDAIDKVKEMAVARFSERWQIVETHLSENGPYHLGTQCSLVDLYMLVTGAYCNHLATFDHPAIDECMKRTAERSAIAEIYQRHIQGFGDLKAARLPQ
ncbi:MAG: glutathione S-transferase N-terminal domain-containing protein [Pseudomonadota bacterium]